MGFEASSPWPKNFKSSYGIRGLEIQEEVLSGDVNFSKKFINMFMSMVNEHWFLKGDVCNAMKLMFSTSKVFSFILSKFWKL